MAILLVIIFSVLTKVINSFEISTCCPKDYILTDVSPRNFRLSEFRCVRSNNISHSDIIMGYNILENSTSNIPLCPDLSAVKINEGVMIVDNSCLGVIDGQHYAITCPERSSGRLVQVNLIKKCCPTGSWYNVNSKLCEKTSNVSERFSPLFDQPTIIESENFNCDNGSVIVDYFSSDFNVSFRNGYLKMGSKNFDTNSFCLQSTNNDQYMIRTCNNFNICDNMACVRKCCKSGEKVVRSNGTTSCLPESSQLNLDFYFIDTERNNYTLKKPETYGIIQQQNCTRYSLNPKENKNDLNYINYKDGSLYIPYEQNFYENTKYCVDFVEIDEELQFMTFVCFEQKSTLKFYVYPYGMLISSIFLALILVVYISLPKLLNLHGKTLISYVSSLLMAYISILIVQLSDLHASLCYFFAFLTYFSFIAAFSWMNIISFDIWSTFRSSESYSDKQQEKRRFILYAFCAWSIPITLTIVAILVDYYKLGDEYIHPNMGIERCWFSVTNSGGHIIFFLVPVGIIVIGNIFMFISTLRYYYKVKENIRKMSSTSTKKKSLKRKFLENRTKFSISAKLYLVMGISWSLEIFSTIFHKESEVWFVTDIFNIFQGVFIFFIFVFKRKVWREITKKYGRKTSSPPTSAATA